MQAVGWLAVLAALLACAVLVLGRYEEALLTGQVNAVAAMTVVLVFGGAALYGAAALIACPFSRDTRNNIRLFAGSIVLMLIAAELVLRFGFKLYESWHEEIGHRYISAYGGVGPQWLLIGTPHFVDKYETLEFEFDHHYNSMGLRDVERTRGKPETEYRIVALGDSFTEGVGAPVDDAWPQRLERRLTKRYPQRAITVFNAGLAGSDPCVCRTCCLSNRYSSSLTAPTW